MAWPARLTRRGGLPPGPTFLIVGAQKAGTRWLRLHLGRHPDVFTAEAELHYFNSRRFLLGPEWYRRQFAGWSGEKAIGESTPGYTMPRQRPKRCAARIDEQFPAVRPMAVLRDPAERVLSAFIHHINEGRLDPSTDLLRYLEANPVEDERFQLVAGGLYAANLAPYFKRFGDRLLVVLNDDIRADPARVYRRALDHVGVDPDFAPDDLARVRFSNPAPKRSRYGAADRGRRNLSHEERAALWPYFAADVARLEELLGRDLSGWSA